MKSVAVTHTAIGLVNIVSKKMIGTGKFSLDFNGKAENYLNKFVVFPSSYIIPQLNNISPYIKITNQRMLNGICKQKATI